MGRRVPFYGAENEATHRSLCLSDGGILRCDCEDRLLGGAPQGEIDAAWSKLQGLPSEVVLRIQPRPFTCPFDPKRLSPDKMPILQTQASNLLRPQTNAWVRWRFHLAELDASLRWAMHPPSPHRAAQRAAPVLARMGKVETISWLTFGMNQSVMYLSGQRMGQLHTANKNIYY